MQENAIPYQIRAKLLQLEPSLDLDWHISLLEILQDADPQLSDDIDEQILKPKEIHWNRIAQTFEYRANTSLAILRHKLLNERMATIAKKLSDSLDNFKDISDCLQIADFLENAIAQINQIPVEEDFVLQREKALIHRTFLLNAAKIIRRMTLTIPKGIRHLTEEQVKGFILEVYIKQQLLDYWFKPLLPKSSPLKKEMVFKYLILREQKVRHFHILKTSEFVYLIAPVMQIEQNPYSIRRFLVEEKGGLPDQIFLNGIAVDMSQSIEVDYIEYLKQMLKKMVTIQSQIHLDVIDVVNQLEEIHEEKIIPLLIEPVKFVAKSVDVVAQIHLKKIEDVLVGEFFALMHVASKKHLSHIEEFDYLYLNAHRMLSEILAYYREFKSQPYLVFSTHVQKFEYKLFAYVRLLEKRKHENFVPLNDYEWGVMHDRSLKPMKELQEAITQNLLDYREINIYISRLKREVTKKTDSLMKRMLKSDQGERDIAEAQKASVELKRRIFMNVLEIPRKNPNTTVFIEFESIHDFTEKMQRHYAFPCGDNGLTRLPMLLAIPETYTEFDIEDFNASIQYDLNFSVSSRAEKVDQEGLSPIEYTLN